MNDQSSSPIFLYQHILCFQFLRKPPNHPHHLFHSIAQILPGGCRFHCFFQRADGAENWEKGVDSGIVTLDGIWGDAAGEGEDGLAVFFSQSGDGDGGFSHSSLSVETTLTGDDDIAVLDERFQRSFFQHDRGARFQDSVHIA